LRFFKSPAPSSGSIVANCFVTTIPLRQPILFVIEEDTVWLVESQGETYLGSKHVICPGVQPAPIEDHVNHTLETDNWRFNNVISVAIRSRVTRGEQIMQRLVDNNTITSSGRDFLIAALDPMHDNQLKDLAGWPDVESASSVVRCIKQTQTYSSNNPSAGVWDFSLNLFPFLQNIPAAAGRCSNNLIGATMPPAQVRPYGGLAGYQLSPGQELDLINNPPAFQLCLNDAYSAGASRIVGIGIEVINTTSALYKQGQIVCWRQPNGSIMDRHHFTLIQDEGNVPLTGCVLQGFPRSVPEASLISGSRQWEAADGAYIVVPFAGPTNPPQLVGYTQPLMSIQWADETDVADRTFSVPLATTMDNDQINYGYLMTPIMLDGTAAKGPVLDNFVQQATKLYPIQQVGCFFTGLSPETSLSITLNVFVETFPTVSEPEILVLATPSAEYDPVALQIFSNALTQLPVAVPAGFNPFGEWFTDIVSTLSDWLTVPATAINPVLGAGIGAAGQMAKSWRTKQGYDKPKKEKRSGNTAPTPRTKPRPVAGTPGTTAGMNQRQIAQKNAKKKQNKKFRNLNDLPPWPQ